ncbi:MAG: helix-turn-helix domain-containing protein [Gemmatimonadaceae bacterium]
MTSAGVGPRIVRKSSAVLIDHPIRTRVEYDAAVAEIGTLRHANPRTGSATRDRLEVLELLVAGFDARHGRSAHSSASPQSIVRLRATEHGLSQGELAKLLGGRSRLSDFYNGKRELSLGQIKAIRKQLGIPADLLIP